MSTPRPPAPIAAAIVARPIEITVAMRTPARTTGSASGSSTWPQPLPAASFRGPVADSIDRRIDRQDPGVRVSQDRQERVDDEGGDRGPRSDAADERTAG